MKIKLKAIFDLLKDLKEEHNTSSPFICGGVPRDRYMQKLQNISDIDLTTGDKSINVLSQELYNILQDQIKVSRKVMPDGHSSIKLGDLKIDFSANFIIPNINKILLKRGIQNPTNMQKEIFSRDFTCNALLLSLDLQNIYDLTNRGLNDINNKIIKTCLDPDITLLNSRNRVVRAIYLSAKLNFDIDPKIIEFVKQYPQTINIGTENTIVEKLNKAFEKDADRAIYALNKMNLWEHIPITEKIYPYYLKYKKVNND